MSYPPRTPSRASTVASQDSKISNAQYAALSGATKAFGRPLPQQRISNDAKIGANGALAAAATVGSRQSSPQGRRLDKSPVRPLAASSTGGSVQSVKSDALYAGRIPNLQSPAQQMRRQQQSKSPSLQAASLAASRATPQLQQSRNVDTKLSATRSGTVRKPAPPPKPRRLSGHHRKISAEDAERPTDNTPIPPTTSLVNLFERKGSQSHPSSRRPDPIAIRPGANVTIKSPQPIRVSGGGLTSVFHMELPDAKAKSSEERLGTSVPDMDSSPDSFASAPEDAVVPSSPGTIVKRPMASRPISEIESMTPPMPPAKQKPPSPPPARNTTTRPVPIKESPPRSSTAMSDRFSPSSASVKSLPAQYNQRYPRAKGPQMTGDQLANAIVASSLATSRMSSPQHADPPQLPSRRQKHQTFAFSRTPSPTKGGMRHTLRKAESESETEDEDTLHPYSKHKRKRHLRKHPNKHHEGDRKRWRDAVTERERKRYEGVWAANKGLYCSFTLSEQAVIAKTPTSDHSRALHAAVVDQVSNLVARDIWSRSNLPDITLESIWDLVDNDCVGRLSKDEFVVGMFLIDYCLKGRKLPVKVSESVWASVRGLHGIKIRKSY